MIYFQNILHKTIVIFYFHKNSFKSVCYKFICIGYFIY
ncbi:hypothetical protein [Citrobacter pasteurii]|nr:hypothetical protein [Citrobacter pasteurii]